MATDCKATETARDKAWRGFKPGPWCSRVNVRDFIQQNYTPYEGYPSFLAGTTEHTRKV
jgi:formate C-acetyltransferase